MSSECLRKRRDFDLERHQPEIQIVAELSLGHQLPQALVRRRDQPEIALHGRLAADRQDFAVLQRAQQFHLQRQADIGHFIEKNRAAVGLLEESLAGVGRPR